MGKGSIPENEYASAISFPTLLNRVFIVQYKESSKPFRKSFPANKSQAIELFNRNEEVNIFLSESNRDRCQKVIKEVIKTTTLGHKVV